MKERAPCPAGRLEFDGEVREVKCCQLGLEDGTQLISDERLCQLGALPSDRLGRGIGQALLVSCEALLTLDLGFDRLKTSLKKRPGLQLSKLLPDGRIQRARLLSEL